MATTATPIKTATATLLPSTVRGTRSIRIDNATGFFVKLFTPEVPHKKGVKPDPKKLPKYSMMAGLGEQAEKLIRDAIAECCRESDIKKIPEGDKMCLRETPTPEDYDGPDLYPISLNLTASAFRKDGKTPIPAPEVLRRDGVTKVTAEEAETLYCTSGGLFRVFCTVKAMSEFNSVAAFIDGVQLYEKLNTCGRLGGRTKFAPDAIEDDEDPVDPDDLP